MILIETDIPRASRASVIRALETAGYAPLGQGIFTTVYGREAGDVVRVQRQPGRGIAAGFDDGWLDYARFAMRQSRKSRPNPHFPRIAWVAHTSDGFIIARMERLARLPNDDHAGYLSLTSAMRTGNRAPTRSMRAAVNRFRHSFASDGRKYSLDLHSGNVMLRPNGDVVITDPVSGKPDAARARKRA